MYRTIDLCAGIGGMRRGFELTRRFENVLSAEIDEQAARTYEHLFPGDNPRNNLMSKKFLKKLKEHPYDVLLAGFPCQAFSSAGLQRGFKDKEKGNVFFGIAQIIRETRPKAIFLENVQNLMSHDGGKTINRIIMILDELDYKIVGVNFDNEGKPIYSRDSFVRNTIEFGLPQNRPRVYIMAFNKRIYGDALKCIGNNERLPYGSNNIIYNSVNELLEPQVDAHYYMASGYLKTLEKHKEREHNKGNGFGYCIVNKAGREPQFANTIMATGGSGKERNLVVQPMPQYNNLAIKGKRTPINDQGIRVMTPLEWGRLQGFIGYGFLDENGEDHFEFPDGMSDGQKYKQFGNSVSIPVIKTMADYMIKKLDELTADPIPLIMNMLEEKNIIIRKDVVELLRVDDYRASYVLKKAVDKGLIQKRGNRRNATYMKSV